MKITSTDFAFSSQPKPIHWKFTPGKCVKILNGKFSDRFGCIKEIKHNSIYVGIYKEETDGYIIPSAKEEAEIKVNVKNVLLLSKDKSDMLHDIHFISIEECNKLFDKYGELLKNLVETFNGIETVLKKKRLTS